MRTLTLSVLLFLTTALWAQDCSIYSQKFVFTYAPPVNTNQHTSGGHTWIDAFGGQCSYSGTGACNVTADTYSNPTPSELGSLNTSGYHVAGMDMKSGTSTSANGGSATADTEAAIAFQNCITAGCGVNVTVEGKGQGAGFTVSFPPVTVYKDQKPYTMTCQAKTYSPPPTHTCSGGGGGGNKTEKRGPRLIRASAHLQRVQAGSGQRSPILVDTTGAGFKLTDPSKLCITFDLANNGSPGCFSWPAQGSGNAWLVYDRNGDGKISNGTEMFGDYTPQPTPPAGVIANGFTALAVYDVNHDLVIDRNDPIWPNLKLWIDTHCAANPTQPCVSLPSELYSLTSKGINSISIVYSPDEKTDAYGNVFKYYAQTNPKPIYDQLPNNPSQERRMYDVDLVMH